MRDIRDYKLQFDKASIPAELLSKKQWVCWDENKVPINPITNGNAKSSDSSTWGTIDEALFCVKKNKSINIF